ncbi:MAG: SDR family oxidoreductase [Alphaproteobacteria bacterium]
MTRVLVTGADGFVGRVTCAALCARGFGVTAAVRGSGDFAAAIRCISVGEIGPETDWRAALADTDAVVHLAARVHVMRESAADPLALYRRINVEGTRRLVEQAAQAGVSRFVFLSTIKVNGEHTSGIPFREDDPPAPRDAYARSKRDAEQAIAEVEGMRERAVVLRAPLVYGPGVKGNFLTLLKAVARGWPLPLGAIENRRSLIYAGNLADAVGQALVHGRAPGKRFMVSDGEDLSTPELVRRLARALGTRACLIRVPVPVLRLIGSLAGRSEAIERLAGSLTADISKIRSELGWRPPFGVDQGLAETARWFADKARGRPAA